MPVSMQFNPGSIHASPAKRAVLDEARMKARAAKSGLNPGPGAYDVKRPIVTAAEVSRVASARERKLHA